MNTYSIAISTSSKEDRLESKELYINDALSDKYMKENEVKTNVKLITSVERCSKFLQNANSSIMFCSLSGISMHVHTMLDEGLFTSASFSISKDHIRSKVLAGDRAYFYSLSEEILSGYIVATLITKDLLRSKNKSRSMDNAVLRTSGKAALVELLMLYNRIETNALDYELLPKLDVSYETHVEGIASFFPILGEYTKIVAALVDELTMSEELRRKKLNDTRRLMAELATINAEKKTIKKIESTYELSRKEAYKALKAASIELFSLNYKKLVSVLATATSKEATATTLSKEVKEKIILRLDEVVSKQMGGDNEELLRSIAVIRGFINLTLRDTVTKTITTSLMSLDASSELKEHKVGKLASLKERLEAIKNRKVG